MISFVKVTVPKHINLQPNTRSKALANEGFPFLDSFIQASSSLSPNILEVCSGKVSKRSFTSKFFFNPFINVGINHLKANTKLLSTRLILKYMNLRKNTYRETIGIFPGVPSCCAYVGGIHNCFPSRIAAYISKNKQIKILKRTHLNKMSV